jgi:hypothetical protein
MLKSSIPAPSKAGKKLKLHPNDRSVISVERNQSANRPILRVSRWQTATVEDLKAKNQQYQMNTTKTLIAGAAVAGLMTGSMAVRAYAAGEPTPAGVSLQTMGEKGAHACKGQNACKGQGGCKSGDNGCKGKNSCKGKGGCATKGE